MLAPARPDRRFEHPVRERRGNGVTDLLELPGPHALPGVVRGEALEYRGLLDRDPHGVYATSLLVAARRIACVLLVAGRMDSPVARDGRGGN